MASAGARFTSSNPPRYVRRCGNGAAVDRGRRGVGADAARHRRGTRPSRAPRRQLIDEEQAWLDLVQLGLRSEAFLKSVRATVGYVARTEGMAVGLREPAPLLSWQHRARAGLLPRAPGYDRRTRAASASRTALEDAAQRPRDASMHFRDERLARCLSAPLPRGNPPSRSLRARRAGIQCPCGPGCFMRPNWIRWSSRSPTARAPSGPVPSGEAARPRRAPGKLAWSEASGRLGR